MKGWGKFLGLFTDFIRWIVDATRGRKSDKKIDQAFESGSDDDLNNTFQ